MFKSLIAKIGVVFAALFSGAVFAALPTGLGAGLSEVKANGMELVDLVWPVIIAMVGAAVIMKLFKRFISKI